MWVFGYGSLTWDGWETKFGCTRRVIADLPEYCRSFNKKSTKNWGTVSAPGPILNLLNAPGEICRGIAFEFPDYQKYLIFSYLDKREGNGFQRNEIIVRIENQLEVSAFVNTYIGKNIIEGKTIEEIAQMVLSASGTNGTCLQYINGIAKELSSLGIEDAAVMELLRAIETQK